MAQQLFPILDRLIREANRVSGRKPDSIEILAHMIRLALDDGADPYLIAGVLLEGAAYTVAHHIPSDCQAEAASTTRDLLAERLASHGL